MLYTILKHCEIHIVQNAYSMYKPKKLPAYADILF